MSDPKELKRILEERGRLYGDAVATHTDIAQMWSGLIRPKLKVDLSAEEVALMFTTFKALREVRSAAAGARHPDNFDDLHNYANIAQDCSLASEKPILPGPINVQVFNPSKE